MMMQPIHISGAERSGSTVLERVLSFVPDAFGLSEFHSPWRMDINKIMRACSPRLHDWSFWSRVILKAWIDADRTRKMRNLEWNVVRHGVTARNILDIEGIARMPEIAAFVERQMAILSVI